MVRIRVVFISAAILLCSAPVRGGLFEDIYRGLQVATTPIAGDSGNRFGRVVIRPNELGQGYRLELNRTFGGDAFGRPEVYDLGNYELQLVGSVATTLRYTRRGILTGNADIAANNLAYSLRAKSGAQDFDLNGTLTFNQQLEVNRLGFYTLDLEVNNNDAKLLAEGLLAEGSLPVDFDLGPITVRGNVFYDATLALMSTFGIDTSELEGVFGKSPIDQITDEITAFLDETTQVEGESLRGDLREGPLSSAAALEARDFVGDVIRTIDDSEAYGSPWDQSRVPEPTSLMLLGLLGLLGLRRRA